MPTTSEYCGAVTSYVLLCPSVGKDGHTILLGETGKYPQMQALTLLRSSEIKKRFISRGRRVLLLTFLQDNGTVLIN